MNLASHFELTPKSVGAALTALIAVAAADDLVSAKLAAALAAAVIPVLSVLVPARACTTASTPEQP